MIRRATEYNTAKRKASQTHETLKRVLSAKPSNANIVQTQKNLSRDNTRRRSGRRRPRSAHHRRVVRKSFINTIRSYELYNLYSIFLNMNECWQVILRLILF